MAALHSLSPAVRSCIANPILLVVAAVFALLQIPQLVLQSQSPLVAAVVSLLATGLLLVLLPLYQGGILGMADEARRTKTAVSTFWTVGKANYISLFVAYLLLIALMIGFAIIAVGALFVGGIGSLIGGGEPNTTLLVVGGLIGVVAGIAYLVAMFFIQFYGHAIVLDDADIVGGFRQSASVVRENLLSVAGYTVIMVVGGTVLGVIGSVASLVFAPAEPLAAVVPTGSLPLLVGGGVVYLLTTAAFGAFYATYSVTFYRTITDEMAPLGAP